MALSCIHTTTLHFTPQASSSKNPNNNNTRRTSKPHKLSTTKSRQNTSSSSSHKLKSQNYPPPELLSSSGGANATTFTRLPPKDDFFLPNHLAEVIKLSDYTATTYTKTRKFDEKLGKDSDFGDEDGENEEELGSGYEGFEVFEAGFGFNYGNVSRMSSFSSTTKKNKTHKVDTNLGEDSNFGSNNDENEETSRSEYERFELYEEGPDFDTENVSKRSGFDYGKFELYEVDSDDNEFDDDDFEEGEMLGLEDEDLEGEELKAKERGLPAVMRCFDRAKIYVKAGDGGNGVMAFRREKFVPLGGPAGGDGGRGGNVYIEVDVSMNSLLPFRKGLHYRAGRGQHGQGQKMNGAKGEDVVVKVPPGTVVREADGSVLLELLRPGQRALLLPGGRGGRGNASFKTGTNKAPRIAENGEEGPEMWLELELKLVADVGIVGAPNAGKSTFLSVISAAQPAIANYPFTTLLPNLGVVSFDYDATMVVADLPGLLEGAHRGFGLGHEFLRHSERCSVLVHVVDGSSEQPEYEFDAVRLELEMFSPELAEKPYIVAYNKMDLPEARRNWPSFRESLQARGIKPFCMSAATRDGTEKVIQFAHKLVLKYKETEEEGELGPISLNHVADMVQKQRTAPISDFEISHDSATNTWHVVGAGLQRFVQMTNWRYADSDRRFQHVLEACGVNKSLMKLGVKEGDTVIVGEMELVWHDAPENAGTTSSKKWAPDSFK